jgi:N-acetylneuraminic acid mutarotase
VLLPNNLPRIACFGIGLFSLLLVGCGGKNETAAATTAPITLTSIAISPATVAIVKSDTTTLEATGTYSDGATADITRSVSWTSTAPAIASIDSATGVVTGVAAGTTTVFAALNGLTSSAANIQISAASLVSISVTPAYASLASDGSFTFTATGTYSDGTTSDISRLVTWSSDNPAVAKINSKGISSGVGAGSSTITAKQLDIVSNTATVTITFAVGGTISGLATGNSITLSNNGVDKIKLNANGPFVFPTRLAIGSPYMLSIAKLPAKQPCTHTYGTGHIQTSNMPALNVICGFAVRGEMVKTADLATARRDHTTTLLRNGKILATGGVGTTDNLASSELFDPTSESWSTTNALAKARRNHTATLLTNGKVLVAGGMDNTFGRLASVELYDPVTGHWSAADNLNTARSQHTATLLPNGQVLVTGGVGLVGVGTLSSAELYDPVTGHWTATGSLTTARSQHSAVLLPDGKVLVIGGVGAAKAGTLSSAEIYDPITGRWTATASLSTARSQHTTTLLPNGSVLVSGGIGAKDNLASAELFNPVKGQWITTGSLASMRYLHTAILLPTGKVLVTGGMGAAGNLSSAELYDPTTGHWVATGNLTTARSQHTATLLSNGKLLLVGGNGKEVLADSEMYW